MAESVGSAIDRETGLAIAREIARGAVWWGGMCAFVGAVPSPRLGLPPRQAVLGGDL